jgi:hypothetical protein
MRILVRLAVVVAITGWAVYYLWLSPARQLEHAADVLKHVHSLRYTAVEQFPDRHNELGGDLVCSPAAVYDARRNEVVDPGKLGGGSLEFVFVGHLAYTRTSDGGWSKPAPAVADGAEETCRRIAVGAAVWFLPDYVKLLSQGNIEKGPKKSVAGIPCREWKIATERIPNENEYTTICTRLDNNLPLQMTFRNQAFTYSDFNQPIEIEVPPTSPQTADGLIPR